VHSAAVMGVEEMVDGEEVERIAVKVHGPAGV
jgi:hypothetical protein